MKKFTLFTLVMITINTALFSNEKQKALPMIQNRRLGDANWGTHQTPLITTVMYTDGPILELGCGDFSTPLLHAICSVNQRMLVSTDSDKKWLRLFLDLERPWHKFIYVPVFENPKNPQLNKWDEIGNDTHWNVVFIDHAPAHRRAVDIERLRPHTDIFVVHDTESPRVYVGYSTILPSFKYKVVYKRYKTETTVVSDTIDVRKFFE